MADERDQLFKLLLSEKEHCDRQFTAGVAANLKILGALFTAVVAGAGWLFSSDAGAGLDAARRGMALLALVALSSVGSLLGSVFNGFAFGFIAYKVHLGERFAKHLGLNFNPLNAVVFVNGTAARRPIVFSTRLLSVCLAGLTLGLYGAGIKHLCDARPADGATLALFWFAAGIAGLMLVAAITSSVLVVSAMNEVRSLGTAAPRSEIRAKDGPPL
jgi:hypothetical protein